MSKIKDSLGRRLLVEHVKANYENAATFAKAARMTQASLSRILRGKVRPNHANMRAIARATSDTVPVAAWLE